MTQSEHVAVLDGEPRELGVVAQPELLQHVTAMGIDGLDADLEVLGDLAVGHAAREHLHHLLLARGERARGVAVARREQLLDAGRDHLLAAADRADRCRAAPRAPPTC